MRVNLSLVSTPQFLLSICDKGEMGIFTFESHDLSIALGEGYVYVVNNCSISFLASLLSRRQGWATYETINSLESFERISKPMPLIELLILTFREFKLEHWQEFGFLNAKTKVKLAEDYSLVSFLDDSEYSFFACIEDGVNSIEGVAKATKLPLIKACQVATYLACLGIVNVEFSDAVLNPTAFFSRLFRTRILAAGGLLVWLFIVYCFNPLSRIDLWLFNLFSAVPNRSESIPIVASRDVESDRQLLGAMEIKSLIEVRESAITLPSSDRFIYGSSTDNPNPKYVFLEIDSPLIEPLGAELQQNLPVFQVSRNTLFGSKGYLFTDLSVFQVYSNLHIKDPLFADRFFDRRVVLGSSVMKPRLQYQAAVVSKLGETEYLRSRNSTTLFSWYWELLIGALLCISAYSWINGVLYFQFGKNYYLKFASILLLCNSAAIFLWFILFSFNSIWISPSLLLLNLSSVGLISQAIKREQQEFTYIDINSRSVNSNGFLALIKDRAEESFFSFESACFYFFGLNHELPQIYQQEVKSKLQLLTRKLQLYFGTDRQFLLGAIGDQSLGVYFSGLSQPEAQKIKLELDKLLESIIFTVDSLQLKFVLQMRFVDDTNYPGIVDIVAGVTQLE